MVGTGHPTRVTPREPKPIELETAPWAPTSVLGPLFREALGPLPCVYRWLPVAPAGLAVGKDMKKFWGGCGWRVGIPYSLGSLPLLLEFP